jgi:hypothetical protein
LRNSGADVLAQYMAPLRQAHAPSLITPGAPAGHVLTDLLRNLRYAARILWKQPAFAGVAVLTLALGIGASMLLTPIMSALLYGVAPTDPVTYAGVVIVLGAVTLLGTYLPARRASRVDPIVALRADV